MGEKQDQDHTLSGRILALYDLLRIKEHDALTREEKHALQQRGIDPTTFSEASIAEYFSLPIKRIQAIIRYPLLSGTNKHGTQHEDEIKIKPIEPIGVHQANLPRRIIQNLAVRGKRIR